MFRPLATSGLALVLGAGPILAEVTPAQVWETFRQSYENMGYQVEVGSQDTAGNNLTLSDIRVTNDGSGDGRFLFVVPRLEMSQTGGGDVRSVVEGPMTLEARNTTPEGEDVGFTMSVDLPGNEVVTSGTPKEMRHRYSIPTVTMTGQALDDVNQTPVTLALTDVQGTQTTERTAEGGFRNALDATADSLQAEINATGPSPDAPDGAGTDSFAATVRIADLSVAGSTVLPDGGAEFGDNPAAALRAGFDADGTIGMGTLNINFQSSVTAEDGGVEDAEGSIAAETGELSMAMSDEGMSYSGTTTGVTTRITSDDMPFPLAYGVERNSFGLQIPVTASDEEQPFALSYLLQGLTLDDALWQSLDPQSTLPREPANLVIDVEGQAVLSRDLLDPEAMSAPDAAPTPDDGSAQDQMPFQPRSLTINDISLDALGATADLSGSLTFGDDPSKPAGSITGTFSGINGLLDNLVKMGIVPQDQLMAPRMMIAMFARPVEGKPDQLQTELEFRDDGSIFANGQQVK
ncbi:DUF2125 domain-containing protein [Paracoccus rhizosphaerae]|uniref:DUF2125 domain-containing protein n=1 Tax=Paracoccus rhizosphaerae TaxID=1133347 RepID=A0ABV6CKS8_9RHOB|nr:DUF2125 domain-containing protein [Paracoccus rhizosphaerae]